MCCHNHRGIFTGGRFYRRADREEFVGVREKLAPDSVMGMGGDRIRFSENHLIHLC